MSIDMQQFNAVFFEEVAEHLTNMESLLLDIDINVPCVEDLNAIFRAAHSIKGGAGIFGFDDMSRVTHTLETLLDKLRKEELTLTTQMIDAFLKAGDILAAQKQVHESGGEPVDNERVKAVCEQLEMLSFQQIAPALETETYKSSAVTSPISTLPDKHISFLVATGENADALLEELALYGQLTSESEVVSGFTKWQLQLIQCSASDESLFDSISFIAEQDSIFIKDIEDEEEDSFGFFDEVPLLETEFGLFDDVEPIVDSGENQPSDEQEDTEEQGYGLFAKQDSEPATQPLHIGDKASVKKVDVKKSTDNTAPNIETSIRVNTEKVDQLINQVGELVITQAMLSQIANALESSEHEVLLTRISQLERNTKDLQESVMSIRMMPISFVFGRFPRVVRDLSSKLNKKIELRLVGDDTELDKGLVEQLADPLTHLIRNSIDHGIEMPEQRIAKGKPETGIITLFAFYEGGNVVININDDGAGLNREKIREKAIERGLALNHNMSDNEIYQLIFSAGFSTAEQVTDVSGRGVGMDVVKRNIHAMGGQVEIHSEAGIGSTISIRLPLTLAILDGMSISVGGHVYIIPLTFIAESLQPQAKDIKTINGKGSVVKVRGDYIPLLALHELFNIDTEVSRANEGILVLLESNNKKIALLVDQLEGQQQVVLKSLETNFRPVPFISGATIMGDGSVALILDVAALVSESD